MNETLFGYPVAETEMPEEERDKVASIQFGPPLVKPPPSTMRSRSTMAWRIIASVIWSAVSTEIACWRKRKEKRNEALL